MTFLEYYLNEESKKSFKTDDGELTYHYFDMSDPVARSEFEDDLTNEMWKKSKTWISMDTVVPNMYGMGRANKLVKAWLDSLPSGTGTLVNPDDTTTADMDKAHLIQWYKNLGFQQVPSKHYNPSLYFVKP